MHSQVFSSNLKHQPQFDNFSSIHMLVVCLYTFAMCVLLSPKKSSAAYYSIFEFSKFQSFEFTQFRLSVNHTLLANQVLLLLLLLLLLYYTKH